MARTGEQGVAGWADDRIREQLRAFLAGRAEWPTYREFQRAGLRTLRDNITRRGGAQRWADELGVPYARHPPGYAPIWTEARIREDLSGYLAGRRVWPSRDEFERDGHTALRNAINRTGGPDRWAAEFGLKRDTRLSGIRRGWTPALIETELRRLIGDRTTWPSSPEFERAGLFSMLTAIYRHEGPAYWAGRMNVHYHAAPVSSRGRVWPKERIRRKLEAFCAGWARWPTEREFAAAGRGTLYRAASRIGGIPYWAGQLGLPRGRPRSSVSDEKLSTRPDHA
jgi:hypothetical protein